MYVRVAARYFYWPRLSEGLPGREKRKGKEGKKERKRRKGKKAKLARKNSGATDFFSPALISRGMSKSRPSTRDGQHDFFSAFFSSLFFFLLSDNRHVTRFDLCYLSSTCSSPT